MVKGIDGFHHNAPASVDHSLAVLQAVRFRAFISGFRPDCNHRVIAPEVLSAVKLRGDDEGPFPVDIASFPVPVHDREQRLRAVLRKSVERVQTQDYHEYHHQVFHC